MRVDPESMEEAFKKFTDEEQEVIARYIAQIERGLPNSAK